MKIKYIINTLVLSGLLLGLSLWCALGPKSDFSESERRTLAVMPEVTWETVSTGKFASGFEAWAVDHFPARDTFRSIKAYFRLFAMGQKDNNGLYTKDGYLSKIEYPMNESMMDHAATLFTKIHDRHLTSGQKVWFAMIPDKNEHLSPLPLDYQLFEKKMAEKLPFATPISISPLLEPEDYYRTDTHWKQESITDVAQTLAEAMGTSISGKYETVTLETPFYGVYVGQSALSVKPDRLSYLTNSAIEGYKVSGAKAVYDLEKAQSRDPYEMFLSGNQPLITVKNPANTSGKRLIFFRDSFGSSIAPLLAEGYSEVVLVDIRYVASDFLGNFVNFENADVLFLYSTLLLNSSLGMR